MLQLLSTQLQKSIGSVLIRLMSLIWITVDDVRECVVKLSSKSCELDPLPGCVTRNAPDTLLPFISMIINASLQSGQMPSYLKVAKLRPLLKKPSLDHHHHHIYLPYCKINFKDIYSMLLGEETSGNHQAYRRGHLDITILNEIRAAKECGRN